MLLGSRMITLEVSCRKWLLIQGVISIPNKDGRQDQFNTEPLRPGHVSWWKLKTSVRSLAPVRVLLCSLDQQSDRFSVSRQLVALVSFGTWCNACLFVLTGINGTSSSASIIPHTEIVSTNTTGPTRPVSQQPSEKSPLSCTSSTCADGRFRF